ncbi:hypothetical protein pipiens_008231 [Culex pipiens pipiens]|uniref:Uncharacterized protein n=1 Tax=Culex pipiens pipiens TaxID=38569 RepID=A0ABD1DIF2_CULPP
MRKLRQEQQLRGRVLNLGEIPNELNAAWSALNSHPFGIFDHFDDNMGQLSGKTLMRAYDLLFIAIDRFGTKVSDELVQSELSQADRLPALNTVKILMYLLGGLVKAINAHFNVAKDEVLDWDNKWNWASCSCTICSEESFGDVICDIALEQSYVKNRSLVDGIFQIPGTAINRYNHALSFPVRILQILEHCEASIAPIAGGVMLLYEEIYPLCSRIEELIERLSMDAADSQTAKQVFAGAGIARSEAYHSTIIHAERRTVEPGILRGVQLCPADNGQSHRDRSNLGGTVR